MQILDDQADRLDLAFPQDESLEGVESPLAALRGVKGLPMLILDRHVKECEEGPQGRLHGSIQREQLARDLLPDLPVIDLLKAYFQVEDRDDDRQIRGGLAI